MAELSIDAFKYNLISGARPSLFEVHMEDDFQFKISATSMPGSKIDPISLSYMGRKLKLAGNRPEFEDWQITVINDVDFGVKAYFEEWSQSINTHATNFGPNDLSYMRDASIIQLDQTGQTLYTYNFQDIWPVDTGSIELGWDKSSEIETFQVTMAVGTYWTSDAMTE